MLGIEPVYNLHKQKGMLNQYLACCATAETTSRCSSLILQVRESSCSNLDLGEDNLMEPYLSASRDDELVGIVHAK